MEQEKEIRFTEKKVDETWKESVRQDAMAKESSAKQSSSAAPETDPAFVTFVRSLAMQGLFHLGQVEDPATGRSEVNLDAARELVEFLTLLKKKTKGNLSSQEDALLAKSIADLQLHYAGASK